MIKSFFATKNKPAPELLYYPCGPHPKTGRISVKLASVAMTKEDAEAFLKKYYPDLWLKCDVIPQPVNHHYFKNDV